MKWYDAEWRLDARCLTIGVEPFFSGKGESTTEPKKICRGCSVRLNCLQSAIKNNEEFGIWGGFGREERLAITFETAQDAIDRDVPRESEPLSVLEKEKVIMIEEARKAYSEERSPESERLYRRVMKVLK